MSSCLILGAGPMGQDHIKVCKDLFPGAVTCYAPSEKRKQTVTELGVGFTSGVLENVVEKLKPSHAIVSTPVETLVKTATTLLENGVKNLLVEKPGFLYRSEGQKLLDLAQGRNAQVFVGYNRRYYSSVRTAKKLINENSETIQHIHFEFTEWSHRIDELTYFDDRVRARWGLANSAHVIDMAFINSGLPVKSKSLFQQQGENLIDWHKNASRMSGAGQTSQGVSFSYLAHWASAGSWSLEWITDKNRYIFKPIESLKVQKRGSIQQESAELVDADLDSQYKPGLFLQNKAFLKGENTDMLVSLSEALNLGNTICDILGYEP